MAQHLFRKATISAYRGIRRLEVPSFRRINIIGGLNGAGKTTLLEALFLLIDQNNPANLSRVFAWRSIPTNLDVTHNVLFNVDDAKQTVDIIAETRNGGSLRTELVYEPQPPMSGPILPNVDSVTGGSVVGITLRSFVDGTPNVVFRVRPATDGLQVTAELAENRALPMAALLMRRTMDNAGDMATRFTNAVTNKRKRLLVEFAQALEPRVLDLSLLQVSNQPVIFATLGGEEEAIVPVAFLGDGVSSFISVAMSIIQVENGVLFIDELDASVHFSRLRKVWSHLITLAHNLNVQIFCATHSREAISAIADAAADASRIKDIAYIRLDRRDSDTLAVRYLHGELRSALDEGWEVR